MIRVAIADDHQLFVAGLRSALEAVPDITVRVTAGDPSALLAGLEDTPVDVLLVDLEMPGGGGIEVLRKTSTPCLIVSMHDDADTRRQALDAGAKGFLAKSAPLIDVAAAIRTVASGGAVPDDVAARKETLQAFSQPKLDPGAESLTERERELLSLLAAGVSRTEELAEQLYISPKTVKNHLASIFEKLAVSDRTQAAIEAIRLGITRPEP